MTSLTQLFGNSASVSASGVLTVDLSELAATSGYDGDFSGVSGGQVLSIIVSSFRVRFGDTSFDPDHSLAVGSVFRSLVDRGDRSHISFASSVSFFAPDMVGNLDPDTIL